MADQFEAAAKFVAAAIDCDPASLRPDSALAQHPNWDSLSHLNVMVMLEREFGVVIDDASIEKYSRLSAIEELMRVNS